MTPSGPNKSKSKSKAAAAAEAARRRQQRTVALVFGGIVVVGVILIVALASGSHGPSDNGDVFPPPVGAQAQAIVDKVLTVPISASEQVGSGSANPLASTILPVTGHPPLILNGKPELLYIGAEYCPYCGTERWAMAVALSRFGTLTIARLTHSSSTDVDANTPTLSFHGSTFTSKYLSFKPIEETTNVPDKNSPGNYMHLDTPTADEVKLEEALDTNGSIPFIDIGNQYYISGATYDVGLLQGKTWSQIASALHDPTSAIAKGALGAANQITAAICKVTKDQPSNVCSNKAITALSSQLK
jgi:hypothetical protein